MSLEETVREAVDSIGLDETVARDDWLSSGCVLVNLAASGTPYGALAKGKYFWMCGDSSSGKTFFTLQCLAEAAKNKHFDGYDLVFDNAEDGALMDVEKFFGSKLAARLIPPAGDASEPVFSRRAEDFYYSLDDRLIQVEKGKSKPFIYLLDSMDSLSTKYEGDKFKEKKLADRANRKAKGDYGDGKAKINSSWIRSVLHRLHDTRSILIVLSQTRDAIGASMYEPSKTVSGGHSLKFYATWQMWTSVGPKIYRSVNGNKRQVGIRSRIAIKKNRLSGKEWTVEVPIYWSSGMDDIGSMVNFLVQEKHWKGGKKDDTIVRAHEFDFEGDREDLVRYIEDNNSELDLKDIVVGVWKEIEEACIVERKPRYT